MLGYKMQNKARLNMDGEISWDTWSVSKYFTIVELV